MRTLVFGLIISAVSVAACDRRDDASPRDTAGTTGLSSPAGTSDEEAITSEIEANLLAHPELERDIASGVVNVDTVGGTVVLTGTVGTTVEKETAVAVAWSVDGVTNVEDRLSVGYQ